MIFGKRYTDYWKLSVSNPVDGLKIPDIDEAEFFYSLMDVKNGESVLDLGCSYGRMYPLLKKKTKNIFGVDPESNAVKISKSVGYIEVNEGAAEKIPYSDSKFDYIFSWAVYDVVDYFLGLKESNRVLKPGGLLLITGKLDSYHFDDEKAFIAEKNAFLKKFPNHFLNLNDLQATINILGFKIKFLFLFPRRGDFGKMKYQMVDKPYLPVKDKYYEHLMIIEKVNDINENLSYVKLDNPISQTAYEIAKKHGFGDPKSFFHHLRNNNSFL